MSVRFIKAISVRQPGANLISSGRQTIETRRWSTDYRGRLLIVSSKNPNISPVGCAVAVCSLVDCRRMTEDDQRAACRPFQPDLYAWVLDDILKLEPFPIRGRYGIYEVFINTSIKAGRKIWEGRSRG